MISLTDGKPYLIATAESGTLVIRASPITVSWIPRDVVNESYNLAGTVMVGTFETLNEAKSTAEERYSIPPEAWDAVDRLPFDDAGITRTEVHAPEIDGHKIVRHGIHWK